MSLKSTAQPMPIIFVQEENPSDFSHEHQQSPVEFEGEVILEGPIEETPLEEGQFIEISSEGDVMGPAEQEELEVELDAVPGAPDAEDIIIEEEKNEVDDINDAKKKKDEKWDWKSKGAAGFIPWIKEKLNSVPKHSGYDTAGIERAISYLNRIDDEISKAMKMDIDEELDASMIAKVREQIDDGILRLEDRLDKVIKIKKNKKKKSKAENIEEPLIKEGQKITGVKGIMITVPLLISGIARLCINGTVSAGKDIEDLMSQQIKKYSLNIREQAELIQLIQDLGYPVRRDRGFLPDEKIDTSSTDNFDWQANYKA